MRSQKTRPTRGDTATAGSAQQNPVRPENSTAGADSKRPPFVQIDNDELLKSCRGIPTKAKHDVWLYYKIKQGRNKCAWPGLDTICADLGLNEKTVREARQWLAKEKWLVPDDDHEGQSPGYHAEIGNPHSPTEEQQAKRAAASARNLAKAKAKADEKRKRSLPNFGAHETPGGVPSLGTPVEPEGSQALVPPPLPSFGTPGVPSFGTRSRFMEGDSCEGDSIKPSPDGVNKKTCDSKIENRGGGSAEEKTDLTSQEKILEPNFETTVSVEQNEIVTLPAGAGHALTLTPPPLPPDKDLRHVPCRELIKAGFENRWPDVECVWDKPEAKQLQLYLKARPRLDVQTFAHRLENYFSSMVNPDRPMIFIPRLDSYAAGPLNQFKTNLNVPIITARMQGQMQTRLAMAEARRRLEEETARQLPEPELTKADGRCEIHNCGLLNGEDGALVCEVAGDGCVFAERRRRVSSRTLPGDQARIATA